MNPIYTRLFAIRYLFAAVLTCYACFASAQQMAPSVIWKKALGGTQNDQASDIIKTADNGLLVVGSSQSNDGDVTGHHGTAATTDAWVVKLSADGNIQWQRSLGGTGDENFSSIIPLADGSYLCIGSTSSNDGDVSGNHGGTDVWVVNINRYGNVLWQKCLGGTGNESAAGGCNTADGNVLMIANTTTNNNGDVTGFHYDNMSIRNDIWVVKINSSNGSIISQRCLGGTHNDVGYDIAEGDNGSFILTADVSSDDGDFGGNGGNPPRGKIAKFSASFVLQWKFEQSRWAPSCIEQTGQNKYIVNSQSTICYPANPSTRSEAHLLTTNTPSSPPYRISAVWGSNPVCGTNYYPGGASSLAMINAVDNIGVGAAQDPAAPGYQGGLDGYVVGFKNSAGGSWIKCLGGSLQDQLKATEVLNDNEYIVAGYSNSNNGDVTGNHGGDDYWIVKLGKTNTIKGTVFLDYNLSGAKDANEPLVNNILVQSEKPGVSAASLSYNGYFSNSVDTGTYQTRIMSVPAYYTSTPASAGSGFTAYNSSDSLSFALQPIPGKRDYRVQLHSPGAHRPGFDVWYKIQAVNAGTDTLVNRSLKLIKDTRLQYLSSTAAPAGMSGDTIFWNIAYLAPRDTASISIELKISPPPAVNIGATLISTAIIDTTGDLAKTDNTSQFHGYVSGAFDPNDKLESTGDINTQEIAKGKYLNYTIRFQNTGNDTAFNVVVRDTLDAKLDWNSLEMISASHAYKLEVINGKILAWTFTNILLVDSVHNEPLSHGYISYRIRPRSTVAAGDMILNSASIYFDFNLPVKTNTTVTTVKAGVPPPSPALTGILANYCASMGMQKGKIANLPHAGDNINVSADINGNVLAIAADSTFSFDVTALGAGLHTLQVIFANDVAADTLRMNIAVDATVEPDVNVSSNITTVVNVIDPVVITAGNAAGGGPNPLYTFAKDRNFNTPWQLESNNNVLAIMPATLQPGDNWIYVRMKTSSNCFASLYNIDSIKISMQVPAPPQPLITGAKNNYCSSEGLQKVKLANLPPATLGANVAVKLDGNTVTLAADSTFSFNTGTLATGAHLIEATYSNMVATRTATVNFTIDAPVTPAVQASASPTSITNQPVVITATGTNGGSSPVYAFAKDRNFTQLLQAEGTNNKLNIGASALNLGENKVYVRMRTSLSCYTAQLATDSITIIRHGVTGLVDTDFPNQRIIPTPNPFRNQLVVYGLSSSKNYSIMLYSQQGRLLYKWRVTGRSTVTLPVHGQPAGTLMLSIYDENKKKLIGTMEVVKQ